MRRRRPILFRKHRCRHCGDWPRDGINRWHGLTTDGYCSRCMNTVPGLANAALEKAWESMLRTFDEYREREGRNGS